MDFEKWFKGLDINFVAMMHAIYQFEQSAGKVDNVHLDIIFEPKEPEPISTKEITSFRNYINKHGLEGLHGTQD